MRIKGFKFLSVEKEIYKSGKGDQNEFCDTGLKLLDGNRDIDRHRQKNRWYIWCTCMYIFAFIHTSVHVGTFSSCTCGYISQLYPLWRPSSNPVAMSKWVSESHSVMSDSLWPHGLYSLQARILEWVAVPFSRGSSQPSTWTRVSCIAGRLLTSWTTREYSDLSFWKPFPSKRNQASLEKWPFPGMQQGKYKI